MLKVTFNEPYSIVDVPAGTSIMDAARKADIPLESPCNQTGVCGKCRVKISPDSLGGVTTPTDFILHPKAAEEGWVLACQTLVYQDIEILHTPGQAKKDAASVLDHGFSMAQELAPSLTKIFDPGEGRTRIFAGGQCIGTEPWDTTTFLYGIAVDIGTTTLVASLVDLSTGKEIDSVSAHNPQSRYAQDVLSRIKFAATPKELDILQTAFIDCLNEMVQDMCQKAGVYPDGIYEAVFSGNTCMLHLAAGISPVSLGRFPYTPQIEGNQSFLAKDLGLGLSPFASVYLPPVISAYVGADLTSGILGLMLHKMPGINLLVDIGTNGEIILSDNGRLTATSTAAGPALEGMNISCGMCAGPGAIERVRLSGDGRIEVATIGESAPQGLCGSGLVDLVAALIDQGVLEPSGRFARPGATGVHPDFFAALSINENHKLFNISSGVHLTQKDVRQVQLAKGAIQAGIEFLLKESGIAPEKVDRVLIAGAFGYHLSTEGLISLKLLPEAFRDKVEYVGNTSKTGAQTFLTNAGFRQEMADLVKEIHILELSGHPEFEQIFIRCLGF